MAQTANEILTSILGVLGQINSKIDKLSSEKTSKEKTTSKTTSDEKTKPNLKDLSNIIDNLNKSVNNLFKSVDNKKIEKSSKGLKMFFDVILDFSKHKSEVTNAMHLFDSLAKSLKGITDASKAMSILLLSFGGAILLFAGGLALGAKILGTSPLGTLGLISLSILVIGGVMIGLTLLGKFITPGKNAIKGMGEALLLLSAGLLGFVISIQLISLIMGNGVGSKGILTSLGIVTLIVAGSVGLFALIGLAAPLIQKGTGVIAGMALGMLMLAGGILALAFVGKIISSMAKVGNTEEDNSGVFGKFGPMVKGLGVMALILLGSVAFFALLGSISWLIMPGVLAGLGISIGMIMLAIAVKKIVNTSKELEGVDVKGIVMKLTGDVIGGIIDGVGGALSGGKTGWTGFATSLKNTAIVFSSIAMLLGISLSLTLLSFAVKGIVNRSKFLEGINLKNIITHLTGDVIGGVIDGVGGALTGGKTGLAGLGASLKNTAILFASIGILMSLALSLSMFAFAISAFAKLGNMKVIKEYKPNGEPVFGPTLNVIEVGQNIARTLGTFFTTLTTTFNDPTIVPNKQKVQEIVDILMGNTGFRILGLPIAGNKPGLIDAISKFSEVIKTFAKVNQIPIYDKEGKVIAYTTPPTVARNIVETLSTFYKEFSTKIPSISLTSTENATRLAQILLGQEANRVFGLKFGKDKPGVIEPIMKFAEMLKLIGGNPNKIAFTDEKGNVTEVDISVAANNIVNSLSTFSTAIAKALESKNFDTDTTKKAIEKIEDIIDAFDNLTKMQSGLEKVASTIGMLAQNIGMLTTNLGELDTVKLNAVSEIGNKKLQANIKGEDEYLKKSANAISNPNVRNTNIYNTSNTTSNVTNQERGIKESEPIDWDKVSLLIGKQVAAALRTSKFTFEFATNNSGVLSIKP